jgi:hypothetical protein
MRALASAIKLSMSKESIRLSCGGELMVVTVPLLRRAPPRLQQLLQQTPDMNGLIAIDRDHTYFAPLIHYLRTGHVAIDPAVSIHGVVAEAACVRTSSRHQKCNILRRYWGFKRVIDVVTGETDLKLLNLGPCYEDWQNARRAQAGELTGRMQIMCAIGICCISKV